MIICVAVASGNVFFVGNCLYVRTRLRDRLLVYRAKIDFGTMWINDIEPNTVIRIDELVNRLVVLIFPGSKYSILNQCADVLVAFVVGKSREFTNITNAVIAERDGVTNEHITFAPTEKMLKLI